jgi:hypothetical protein
MQELYYSSASLSLQLIREDKSTTNFTVTNLIVCSSLYEIIAFTGSTQLVSFPIENTNLYYSNNIIYPTSSIPIPTSSVSLLWNVQFTQNTLSNSNMSSSFGFIYSGSIYYVSQSNGVSSNGLTILNAGSPYTASIGCAAGPTYDTYISLYDLSIPDPIYPGSIVFAISGSSTTISASFFLSGSHTYQADLIFVGKT